MSNLEKRIRFASDLARKAGRLALDYYKDIGALTVVSKGVQDMATEADINTENLIRQAIEEQYPQDAFFGEESNETYEPKAEGGVWVVDPIDGTQPFISSIPSWCISIAYIEDDSVRLGVIYDPCHDELFVAGKGMGAQNNGKAMSVSPATSFAEGLVSVGYSNRVSPDATLLPLARLMTENGMFHRSGSGALSLAYVAAGRLIGYFEPHMNVWDCAAGMLLIEEAGGRAINFFDNQDYLKKGGLVVGATKGVYPALLAIVEG
ncbi:inositol monophosphatase family protein [Lacimicrobium alkaliphilum]|uniref:Inositol-1-monophosphatase n=1 Tax=Lacimicrobium alkaliphilum TaxID=1526571 RepID=A0A0U3A9B0_9ALTE|nr:inositol monophosphatase [Lacimicrobium alkaliphilum]ALS97582.1 hypothetical protein AT746_04395 [Lacimicrobium alkaliphilum]